MECSECATWKMAAKMVMLEDFFYSSYNEDTKKHEGGPYLCVNMNDVFAWATADAEHVPWKDVPEVYDLWKKDGKDGDGVFIWACKKRGNKPQKPVFDKLKPETQEILKDLPRFGDVTVPTGDGMGVTFDDGWKGSEG